MDNLFPVNPPTFIRLYDLPSHYQSRIAEIYDELNNQLLPFCIEFKNRDTQYLAKGYQFEYSNLFDNFNSFFVFYTRAKIKCPHIIIAKPDEVAQEILLSNEMRAHRVIAAFIKKTIGRFEIPSFFYEHFSLLDSSADELMFHLLSGKNIRTFPTSDFLITKKHAHYFTTLYPTIKDFIFFRYRGQGNTHFEGMIYESYLQLNGLTTKFIKSISNSFLNIKTNQLELFLPLLKMLSIQKKINWHEVRSIYDFLNYKFSFNNNAYRIPLSFDYLRLLRRANRWHLDWQRANNGEPPVANDTEIKWNPFPIKTFYQEINNSTYHIIEITDAHQLWLEGKCLHHCAYSYINNCLAGRCRIFSLQIAASKSSPNFHSLITIELSKEKEIKQLSGKFNQIPNNLEIELITEWAKRNNFSFFKYQFN